MLVGSPFGATTGLLGWLVSGFSSAGLSPERRPVCQRLVGRSGSRFVRLVGGAAAGLSAGLSAGAAAGLSAGFSAGAAAVCLPVCRPERQPVCPLACRPGRQPVCRPVYQPVAWVPAPAAPVSALPPWRADPRAPAALLCLPLRAARLLLQRPLPALPRRLAAWGPAMAVASSPPAGNPARRASSPGP